LGGSWEGVPERWANRSMHRLVRGRFYFFSCLGVGLLPLVGSGGRVERGGGWVVGVLFTVLPGSSGLPLCRPFPGLAFPIL
jgi:hypothetical protein